MSSQRVVVTILSLAIIGGLVVSPGSTTPPHGSTANAEPVIETASHEAETPAQATASPSIRTPEPTTPISPSDTPVALTWGTDATAPSSEWVRPGLFEASADPVYGTLVRRLTSAEGTRFDRNTYSRRQAENAAGDLVMSYHGNAEYRVTNRITGTLVSVLPIHPDAEPQWHPSNPNLIRHLAGDDASTGELRWYEHDLRTGRSIVIADLTDRILAQVPDAKYLSDRAEGSPSADGNRVAWLVHNSAEEPVALVSYDLATDRVLGLKTDLAFDAGDPNWVSMSASGRYVVAGHLQGTFAYDAEGLANERQLNGKADHSDLGFDVDGRDVYVAIDFSVGPDAGWLTSIDLGTGEVTRIFQVYGGANTSVHVSTKGFERPGWVIVSTYNCKDDGAWTCDKVFAAEIATGRVLNLAHTYNCGSNYWTEAHAVVNRSFTRVYFNSDAGSCGIDAEVYELTLPEFG